AVQAGAQPSNVLVITDTGENNSGEQIFPWPPGGDCSACVNGADAHAAAIGQGLTVYVMDMTNYVGGPAPAAPSAMSEVPGPGSLAQSDTLQMIAQGIGGLYFALVDTAGVKAARAAIVRDILKTGQRKHHPVACVPGGLAIDAVQQYAVPSGAPISPYNGTVVTVQGVITVPRGTY